MSEVFEKAAIRNRKSGQAARAQKRDDHGSPRFTVGRSSFGKISAVEGIEPTAEALARAREFDCAGLSPEERRKLIIEAYRVRS